MKIRSFLFPPGSALVLCLLFSIAAAAQPAIGSVEDVPKFPGHGGQYPPPSDITPGPLPSFNPNDPSTCPPQTQAVCDPSLLTGRCGASPSCPALALVELDSNYCIHCQDDEQKEGPCYATQGWSLTFGQARSFCHAPDPACLDSFQNVTVCAAHPASCEIHLFESGWINHNLSQGRPVCAPVAVQACLGNQALFDHPQAFDFHDQGTGECGNNTVCLTFNKDCLCNAVLSWENALGLGTGSSPNYDHQILFHIGFTTCTGCECPVSEGIPVDP